MTIDWKGHLCMGIMFTGFFLLGRLSNQIPNLSTVTMPYDEVRPVGCGSNSMGPNVFCGDQLLLKSVQENQTLKNGAVYVFKNPYNTSMNTVHRLVAECNGQYIFKGDANKLADPLINRSDVYYEVLGELH